MKKNLGFSLISILIIIGLSIIGSYIANNIYFRSQEKAQLGTGSNIFYTTSVLPNSTSTVTGSIGTTSESGDRRFLYGFIDYATSTALDIYDSLIVGRTASTTINSAGNVTVQNLTVNGTCTGCGAGSNPDLQDAYNNAAADGQLTTTNNKNLIFFSDNTAIDANIVMALHSAGGGQFLVQNTNGSATTTVLRITRDGSLGIGTTSVGVGIGVYGTTTNLSDLVVEGVFKGGDLIATNTFAYRGSATSTWSSAGISVAGGGLASSQGLTLTGGDIQSAGRITDTDTATSTFSGGISAVGLATSQGLTISAGDLLFTGNGRITVIGTATSSLPNLNVATFGQISTTSTSQLLVNGVGVTAGATTTNTTINFRIGNGADISVTGDTTLTPDGQQANQVFRLVISHDQTSGNSDIAWASSTASFTFYFSGGVATTTSLSGRDICSFAVDPADKRLIYVSCVPAFIPR